MAITALLIVIGYGAFLGLVAYRVIHLARRIAEIYVGSWAPWWLRMFPLADRWIRRYSARLVIDILITGVLATWFAAVMPMQAGVAIGALAGVMTSLFIESTGIFKAYGQRVAASDPRALS